MFCFKGGCSQALGPPDLSDKVPSQVIIILLVGKGSDEICDTKGCVLL